MYRFNNAARILPVALILSLFACKKKEDTPIDTGVTMAPPAAAPVVALRVNGIETGKGINADKTIKDDAHDFGVRDTIYTSVKTEGAGTGKLAAKWTYQGGKTVNETSHDISPTGDQYHEFHIVKATAWPKGDYKIEILLDGVSAGTKDFTIK
jgi:hypothetical protein